jgi:hypothetical protein
MRVCVCVGEWVYVCVSSVCNDWLGRLCMCVMWVCVCGCMYVSQVFAMIGSGGCVCVSLCVYVSLSVCIVHECMYTMIGCGGCLCLCMYVCVHAYAPRVCNDWVCMCLCVYACMYAL